MIGQDTVSNYLAALAGKGSTPGGGAATGLTGAQAAALISMVCRSTRKNPEAIKDILAAADMARDRFIQLADKDMQCFDAVMTAYKASAQTDGEQAHRSHQLQQALKAAATVPREMIDEAITLIPLTERLVEIGNRNLITDTGIAASLLECVLSSSRLNILVNLKAIDDQEFVDSFNARLTSTTELINRARDINNQIETILQQP